jgi:lysophospholipid acyltransferase (LPLAT)-like uncharacterized protein
VARKDSLNPVLLSLITGLVAFYIRLVHRTLRWEWIGHEKYRDLIASGQPFICAFWHSRLLMMPILKREQPQRFAMLISDHRDGELIAQVMTHFDIESRRGSAADPRKKDKRKGGAGALKALVDAHRQGFNTGVTPDGPRGPRQRAQAGVAQLARLAGVPVIPLGYSARRAKRLESWDRFLLPFPVPFSKGVFIAGDPIYVTGRGADAIEAGRRDIEAALNRVTEIADRAAGIDPVSPEPQPAQPAKAEPVS